MKAIWGVDYDMHTDECYNRPTCPACDMPLFSSDGACCGCGKTYKLDEQMKQWFLERDGVKEETTTCINCGKESMVMLKHKNKVTLEWETRCGECSNCGVKFIV